METMYNELIRDNDDIIDAMGDTEIANVVRLVQKDKNPEFLELLSLMCECDERAKKKHQERIVNMLLESSKPVVYITELLPSKDEVRISVSGKGDDWVTLREFVDYHIVNYEKRVELHFG